MLLVDVQGVKNKLTDPEISTLDMKDFCIFFTTPQKSTHDDINESMVDPMVTPAPIVFDKKKKKFSALSSVTTPTTQPNDITNRENSPIAPWKRGVPVPRNKFPVQTQGRGGGWTSMHSHILHACVKNSITNKIRLSKLAYNLFERTLGDEQYVGA